jgi:hypothetical protein
VAMGLLPRTGLQRTAPDSTEGKKMTPHAVTSGDGYRHGELGSGESCSRRSRRGSDQDGAEGRKAAG